MFEQVPELVLDTVLSWIRIFAALGLSIVLAWILGITAARNRSAERIIVPILDILQAVPVLGFLPVILVIFVTYFPPSVGVELAVISLIISGLGWSMAFAVYEAVNSIPKDILELAEIEKMTRWTRVKSLYIPASWSKVAYNSSVFWSAAVFYLASSEIFSLGSTTYTVGHGIGADLAVLSVGGMWAEYATGLVILVLAVVLTRFLFLGEFALWSEKFKVVEEPRSIRSDPIYRFYSLVDREFRSRVLARLRARPLPLPQITKSVKAPAPLKKTWKALLVILAIGTSLLLIFLNVGSVSTNLSFPAPGAVEGKEENVLVALFYSTIRIWGVYALAAIVGLPLGVTIGLSSRLFNIGSPILQVVSSIPAPVFLPVLVVFAAGTSYRGELVAEFVIFLGMIWYITFNVMQGVRTIPSEVWEVTRLAKMNTLRIWRHVAIPAAYPAFITGSVTAVGGGWSVLVVAEYFQVALASGSTTVITQVSSGVGKLLALAAIDGDFTSMSLALISMTALIVAVDKLLWRRLYRLTTTRFSYNR